MIYQIQVLKMIVRKEQILFRDIVKLYEMKTFTNVTKLTTSIQALLNSTRQWIQWHMTVLSNIHSFMFNDGHVSFQKIPQKTKSLNGPEAMGVKPLWIAMRSSGSTWTTQKAERKNIRYQNRKDHLKWRIWTKSKQLKWIYLGWRRGQCRFLASKQMKRIRTRRHSPVSHNSFKVSS